MKTKTLLEFLTLTSSLYVLVKDTEMMNRIKDMSQKGKDSINKAASETQLDADGNEMEFIDKIIFKSAQVKEELEQNIEEMVAKFYKKIHVAHLDDLKAVNEKLEKADQEIALLEARLNRLEVKK